MKKNLTFPTIPVDLQDLTRRIICVLFQKTASEFILSFQRKRSPVKWSYALVVFMSWLAISAPSAWAQNGYIYVHKSTLNEEASPDFSFSGSLGSFTLNDQPASVDVIDVGAGENRLWAVANGGQVYARSLGSASWTQIGSASTAVAVDGGSGNTAVMCNAAGVVFYWNGSGFTAYSGSVDAEDVAFDRNADRLIYVDKNNGVYWKNVSAGASGSWNQISGIQATRVDASAAGAPQITYVTPANAVRRVTYAGVVTNYGVPSGSTNTYDATTADDGTVYAAIIDNSGYGGRGERSVFRYNGSSWVKDVRSRGIQFISGGPGGQVWGKQSNGSKTIWSRPADGTWLDDERVRTSPANGNSAMFSVAAGSYTITESAVSGWALQTVTLYDPSSNSSANISGRSATLNVAAGEVVHVVFENGLIQSTAIASTCASSFVENFGSGSTGTLGGALTGLTNYHFAGTSASTVVDGYYSVVNRTQDTGYGYSNGQLDVNDHTSGNGTGRFLFVNADYQRDVFYRRRFTGLVVGTPYRLSYWVLNVTGNLGTESRIPAGGNTTLIAPNVGVAVYDHATGNLLGSNNSGDITTVGVWVQRSFTFTATQSSIDLLLRNNTIGGFGNDLGIDDIQFSVSPPNAPTASVTAQPSCSNATGSITVSAPSGSNYTYSIDGTNYQSGTVFNGLAPGSYNVTVRNTSTQCTSSATTLRVNAAPGAPGISTQPSARTVCSGSTTTFTGSASGSGLTYQWYYNGSALEADHSDSNGSYSGSKTATLTITPGPGSYFFGGQFSLQVTSSGGCSVMSNNATLTVNVVPDQPTLSVASQPSCSVSTGSFTITNYNSAYSYSVNPPSGVSQSSNTVTAPAGTYTVTASNNGCSSVASSPVTLTSPTCSTAVPDLTPIIYARPSSVHSTTPITVVVDVVELLNAATTGLITVKVSREDLISLNFNASATTVNNRSVQNSVWSFDASSDPDYYILTTNSSVPASGQLSFGLTGTLTPGATAGILTLSAVIVGGSGGETKITNNADADKIDYFQN